MKILPGTYLVALTLVPAGATVAPQKDIAPPVSDKAKPVPHKAQLVSDKAQHYALGYFLPKGRATVNFSQRLVQCPSDDTQEIRVEARAQIAAKSVPDYARLYRIDARAGFLAKRQTDLSLYENGTIKGVNATVEGQGGAVIVSAVKLVVLGAKLASGSVRPFGRTPKPLEARCLKAIADLVDQRDRLAATIADLEAQFAADGTLSNSEVAELDHQRKRLVELDNALTLTSETEVVDPSNPGPIRLLGLKYDQWFDPSPQDEMARLPGDDGVLISWAANAAAQHALIAAAYSGPEKPPKPGEVVPTAVPEPVLYYRRPVPVTIAVEPCTKSLTKPLGKVRRPEGLTECTPDRSPEAAALTIDTTAGFPQLSGLYRLPIGRGGLFGSRSVAAEFNEAGAPTQLRYGSSPGAADIAAALDAARDAGTTWQNRKQEALDRQAAELRLRKEIRELEAALEKE